MSEGVFEITEKEEAYLSNYDVIYLGKKVKTLYFMRDTLEKVTILADYRNLIEL